MWSLPWTFGSKLWCLYRLRLQTKLLIFMALFIIVCEYKQLSYIHNTIEWSYIDLFWIVESVSVYEHGALMCLCAITYPWEISQGNALWSLIFLSAVGRYQWCATFYKTNNRFFAFELFQTIFEFSISERMMVEQFQFLWVKSII